MQITIINDCRDANAAGRQVARIAGLCKAATYFVGVTSDLEAAGNLIDMLDASADEPSIVLVNVAPRNGGSKKWENGSPFVFFHFRNTLVLASMEGLTLSLVRKLSLVDAVTILDIAKIVDETCISLAPEHRERIKRSQFRSFDFLPLAATALITAGQLPGIRKDIGEVAFPPDAVWWIDNFGNCKTTLIKGNVVLSGGRLGTVFGDLPFYERLKDVPNGGLAVIEGSSGIDDRRFLEIVIQGGSAAQHLRLRTGDSFPCNRAQM